MNPANDTGSHTTALFCPACGGADITSSSLSSGEASCNVCDWKGKSEELVAYQFTHGMGSQEQVFRLFFLDIRKMLGAKLAQELGGLLVKWGFLDVPNPKNKVVVGKQLARYLASAAKALVTSMVQTRAEIEKERVNDDRPSA
jgi:hypothetical protein